MVYLPGELTSAQHEFLATLSEHAIVEVILGLTGDAEAVDEHTASELEPACRPPEWSAER